MSHPARPGATVGRNVRHLRTARGLTAGELARAADLSRATLTEIEAGRANPTVDTLAALAQVLGATLDQLLIPPVADDPIVVRAGAGAVVLRSHVRFRLIHRLTIGRGLLETWEGQVDAGHHRADPLPRGTLVAAYAAAGAAVVGPADAPVALETGDSVLYCADIATTFGAETSATLLLTVVYPPASVAEALSTGLV